MSNVFNVNLERFSGPYFKILELIENRKLSINELSLSEITDDYISFVRNLEKNNEKNIIDISEFISIASTLMLIKARSLFPNLIYTEEEKKEVSNLEKKLELYKIVLNASKNISKIYKKEICVSLPKQENNESVFLFDKRLDKNFLHSIAIASLLKFPKIEKLKKVAVSQILKIEDVINNLLERINFTQNISLKEFSNSISNKFETFEERKKVFIISFLAMLELIKNGAIDANQNENNHNEIFISKK